MPIPSLFKPLYSRVRGRLGRSTRYQERANRSWVVSPAVEATAAPAVFVEDDLQRVTGVHPDDTIEGQIQRARGGRGRHDATMAYELDDAVLCDGNLFTDKVVMPVSGRKLALLAPPHLPTIQRAALASSLYGVRFFGHWIADDLLTLLAAQEIDEPITVLRDPLPSQSDYLRLMGLAPRVVTDARFERIVVIDDVGQNAYKRARYQKLFEIGQRYRQPPQWSGVFLLRGDSGARRVLTNEAEVVAMARRRHMAIVDPHQTSSEELINICSQCDLVMGVEGSHLYNGLMWMPRSGSLIVIQPPTRFVMVSKDLCDCVGIRMAFIVGHQVNETDFRVDLSALERLCDRTARSIA